MPLIERAAAGALFNGTYPGQALVWDGSAWVPTLLASMQFKFTVTVAPATTAARFAWIEFAGAQTSLAAATPMPAPCDGQLTTIQFLCSAACADAVLCTVLFDGSDTALALNVPGGALVASIILPVPMPVRMGTSVGLRLNQASTSAQAGWNARWIVQ